MIDNQNIIDAMKKLEVDIGVLENYLNIRSNYKKDNCFEVELIKDLHFAISVLNNQLHNKKITERGINNGRLIDEGKLISDLRECIGCKRQDNMPNDYFKLSELEFLLSTQSTAYDINSILKKLEKKIFTADLYEHGWNGQTVDNLLCFGDVYEILKGGLINE